MCSNEYWTGLYAEMDKEQLIEGVNTMLRVTEEIFAAQRAGDETKKRLRNNDHTDNDDA